MSCFSTALQKTLASLQWTQKQLADSSGINRPQINRYAKGTGGIELSGVAAILSAIPEEYQAELLAAWLKDQTPQNFDHLVSIFTNDPKVKEETDDFRLPSEADPELRKLMHWVIARCIHNKDFRAMLENMRRLIEG